jgi:hypothetical protein
MPGDEVYCGLLQLIAESLTGDSFDWAMSGALNEPITVALQIAAENRPLDFEAYDEVLRSFISARPRE